MTVEKMNWVVLEKCGNAHLVVGYGETAEEAMKEPRETYGAEVETTYKGVEGRFYLFETKWSLETLMRYGARVYKGKAELLEHKRYVEETTHYYVKGWNGNEYNFEGRNGREYYGVEGWEYTVVNYLGEVVGSFPYKTVREAKREFPTLKKWPSAWGECHAH
jgi:hypothetical protein